MENEIAIRKLTNRILKANRRLLASHADPRNSDRASWGSLAVASFANVTGQSADVETDPETVLGDLLAGLMHWSDVQKARDNLEEPIDFESALERARHHYQEECDYEREEFA